MKLKIGSADKKHSVFFPLRTGQVFPIAVRYISFNGVYSQNWESFKLIWHQIDRWLNSIDE